MHDTTSFTAVRSHTSRHTHTYTDNHSTISIHNNTIGHSTCINGTHCYDIPSSTTHVNHGIPLLYTTFVTHSRSPTSRHTHTYTDSHTPISIHNNTIGHSTCINGTHCYDIPSSTIHVNQSNQCMTPLLSLLYVHTHPDTHTHTQIVTHQSVFTTTPLVIAHASMVHTAMTYHHQQYM